MLSRPLVLTLFIGALAVQSACADTAQPHPAGQDLELSPEVMNLLRAEMEEITAGMQTIAVSLAAADWGSIQETSERIQSSYIMKRKITQEQASELEQSLPQQFKQLDAEFHQRAEKLGEAAADHDAELVAFHYSRLMESCAGCHAAYAKERFPDFSAPEQHGHSH